MQLHLRMFLQRGHGAASDAVASGQVFVGECIVMTFPMFCNPWGCVEGRVKPWRSVRVASGLPDNMASPTL